MGKINEARLQRGGTTDDLDTARSSMPPLCGVLFNCKETDEEEWDEEFDEECDWDEEEGW